MGSLYLSISNFITVIIMPDIVYTYAKVITMKSSQFHASRKYVKGAMINPRPITLVADSKV